MQILISASHNPYFNIACEEFIIKRFSTEVLFLYQNTPSVIVGKHQNAFSEINQKFVHKHGIDVVRRLSGGGSVYHDPGNLNFAHIKNVSGENKVDFSAFLKPVIHALNEKGINVEMGPRNNLQLNGKKITGTACHTIKNRVMHHGTLLINANLQHLQEVLIPVNKSFESKAVKSISSQVTNIFDEWKEPYSLEALTKDIANYFIRHHEAQMFNLSNTQVRYIQKLVEDKYATWEWNYGYSPKFSFEGKMPGKKEKVVLFVEKGMVTKMEHENGANNITNPEMELVGKPFDIMNFEPF